MMKIVLKLDFHDEKTKQKALQKVSRISGIESIAVDTKDKKLTIIGGIDPVSMVAKLRKLCHIEIVTVGPAKEPEKKKEEPKQDPAQLIKAYEAYYQQNPYYHQYQPYQQPPAAVPTPAYFMRSVEEDPNGCIIC